MATSDVWCVKCKKELDAGDLYLPLLHPGDVCEDCAREMFWVDMTEEGKHCEKCGWPCDDMYILSEGEWADRMVCEECFKDLLEEARFYKYEPEPDDGREEKYYEHL